MSLKSLKQKILNFTFLLFALLSIFYIQSCNGKNETIRIDNVISQPDIEAEDSVFSVLSHYYNVNPDSALIISQHYEKTLKAAENYRGLIRLYSFLSELYQYRINDDVCALNYISKAMDLLAEHPNVYFDNPFLFINAGNILNNYGMFQEAIDVYKQIEDVIDLKERPEVRTLIDNNIGLSFKALDMCDSAKNYHNKAMHEIDKSDPRAMLMEVQCLNYLSSLALDCGQSDSVPVLFKQSEALFAQIDSLKSNPNKEILWNDIRLEYRHYRLRILANMGFYQSLNGNFELSLEYYSKALDEAKMFEQVNWIPVLYAEMSQVYVANEEYKTALSTINLAINVYSEQMTYNDLLIKHLKYKAEILVTLGDTDAAENILQQAQHYNDSLEIYLQSEEVIRQKVELAVKPIQFSMKKIELQKDRMLETMKMQLKIAEQNKKISLFRWLIISGTLFISLLILIFIVYRARSKKRIADLSLKAAEKEKKFMTSELQNFSMHLVRRNDFLREIQVELKSLVKDASEKNKSKIKALNMEIIQNLQSAHGSKLIEEKINEINTGFLFLLEEKFPNLTENDKNLCALVRMNLTSKEIASIKNISERSVITARYRLRQKLNLETKQNLNDFLRLI
ncbi:MAG: hypothetical protein U9N51_12305 [Bacteroidota bacterium]|nr:hypothetical protein [Bacteroidota bacterium]